MYDVHEHKRALFRAREAQGQALGKHRQEIDEQRRAWRRVRQAKPALHRTVLADERQKLRESARMHKTMLVQNRWLVALAERLQPRLKKAG